MLPSFSVMPELYIISSDFVELNTLGRKSYILHLSKTVLYESMVFQHPSQPSHGGTHQSTCPVELI